MARLQGRYTAQELLTLDLTGGETLIEGLLWKQDTVVFFGKEKSGKSIFSLQLACALSSGHPFLGQFEVPHPVPVAYIQAEGKLSNTKSNLERMMRVVPCTPSNLCFFYYPSLAFETEAGEREVMTAITGWQRPEVIIVDPLYMFFQGDLENNQESRRMVASLRRMAEVYQTTLVVVHHAHRPTLDTRTGQIREEGDDAIFGSFVWKAYPDNVFLLEKKAGKLRRFVGATQRMDKAPTDLMLSLIGSGIENDPLYFAIESSDRTTSTQLFSHIPCANNGPPITRAMLMEKTGQSKATVWRHLNELKGKGLIRSVDLGTQIDGWYRTKDYPI